MMKSGTVYLVGAGPGDPGLITVRGAEVLGLADCVIYDGLANPALLRYASDRAELVCVKKRIGPRPFKQPEITRMIVEKAQAGNVVVRLKGGDPAMFGRAQEELVACMEAGIDFEIVPGITAAMAGAEYCGMFLTDRRHSSQVIFVTGQEAQGKDGTRIDWDLLAGFCGTIVFYMGMTNLEKISGTLIARGKDSDTPVAVIQNATLPNQRLLHSRLNEVAEDCRVKGFTAPAIVVIGESAAGQNCMGWFVDKPLVGQRVVITRDAAGNAVFAEKLEAQGVQAICFDSIELQSLTNSPHVRELLEQIQEYDWVLFTSANGVRFTFDALERLGLDARAFAGVKIGCIGKPTAEVLAGYGMAADFVPTRYTSAVMAEELADFDELHGKKVLLLRSGIAPEDLVVALHQQGADVRNVPVYTTVGKKADLERRDELIERITQNGVDWITFTSSSTVDSFFEQIAVEVVKNSTVKSVSIGPFTTERLRQKGVEPDVEAIEHSMDGIIECLKSQR